ncbi:unnamed protein product [Clonostachys rosea f. rosea IK726]|uniref:Uncharacterized protein n=1 Tax=Clonostachys rosea f. rosea IK726 TaxID=1349383 RepID=A0ACA9TJA7_BIOOC|nr:unnamed protein product [Clonostachys rosea f. rosea IK726]
MVCVCVFDSRRMMPEIMAHQHMTNIAIRRPKRRLSRLPKTRPNTNPINCTLFRSDRKTGSRSYVLVVLLNKGGGH